MNILEKNIVVIGGGAVGLSAAYHLGKLGCSNVMLLEQNELSSGTSWHAAGIVGPLRATQNLTELAKYALTFFEQIEVETGQATGYKQTGGLWLTKSHDRITELRRIAAMGEMNDLHGEFMSPGELSERFPMINHHDLVGAMYLPQDGQINPVDLCMALAKGGRSHGVEIREHTGVMDIEVKHGIATSLTTDSGEVIECDIVVNCAGLWARSVAELAGVNAPVQAVEHMYVVTEPIPELRQPWPVCRDMEGALYIKEDAGKLVLGVFEPNAKLWDHKSVDRKSSYLIFEEDWDHIEPMLNAGINRIPRFESIGISHFMTGPESFTPDTKQLMGRSAEVENFFVAAGMNSLGIMSSPGVGKAVADWVVCSDSPIDLWEVDIMRFQPKDNDPGFVRKRTVEAVSNQFDMHWPLKQYKTGRDRTQSIWHEKMAELGAVFGAPAGWERPLWFAQDDEPVEIAYGYGEQCWWPAAKRESEMLENAGAIFELSPFTNLLVDGKDATQALQWICSNNIDVAIGKVVYTLMLNERGGMESELTVTRTADDAYLLTSASLTRIKDACWVRRHSAGFDVAVRDCTDDFAILGVMGPRSRDLLQSICETSFATEKFPFGTSLLVDISGVRLRASRLSFVGELGWELMIPVSGANTVLDTLLERAKEFNIGMAGFMTMECCRLEKGYLHWGHEIGPEENPLQAHLAFAVAKNKENGFLGFEAFNQLSGAQSKLLVLFESVNTRPLLLHDEPIYRNGEWIGRTTSGGPGFRTGKNLCFGYIDAKSLQISDQSERLFEVKIAGQLHQLKALRKPPYDPSQSRMRR